MVIGMGERFNHLEEFAQVRVNQNTFGETKRIDITEMRLQSFLHS